MKVTKLIITEKEIVITIDKRYNHIVNPDDAKHIDYLLFLFDVTHLTDIVGKQSTANINTL